MTTLEIDAFEKNAFKSAIDSASESPSPSPLPLQSSLLPGMTPGFGTGFGTGIGGLQTIIQTQLAGKLMSSMQTGNPMIDIMITTCVQAVVLSVVSIGISQISVIASLPGRMAGTTWVYALFLCRQLYYRASSVLCKKRRKYPRMIDIPYISDTRQINELYKAVFWYLTNNDEIDYLHEPYLQFVFEKKISLETRELVKQNLAIHKILSQKQTKKIQYKNHDINYSLSTELITVYTDKDRKRENFKVSLWTELDEAETKDILETFCQHCLVEYSNSLSDSVWKQLIYTNKGTEWTSSPSNNSRKMDTIILKNNLKDQIKTDLQMFLDSEEWYKDRDIPYTRGYMFYGQPGTGKTSMIKAMSLYCKRHIHYLMLSEIANDAELFSLLKSICYKNTILVIEDIDATLAIVKSREKLNASASAGSNTENDTGNSDSSDCDSNKESKSDKNRDRSRNRKREKDRDDDKDDNKENSKLTLSGLLNAIDGVFSCHGRILIMTTNHPEVLDSALIRPGRVDCKYLFDNCSRDQIERLYEMFFNQPVNKQQLVEIKSEFYSPAHIASVFLRYRNNPEDALLHLDDLETRIEPRDGHSPPIH